MTETRLRLFKTELLLWRWDCAATQRAAPTAAAALLHLEQWALAKGWGAFFDAHRPRLATMAGALFGGGDARARATIGAPHDLAAIARTPPSGRSGKQPIER